MIAPEVATGELLPTGAGDGLSASPRSRWAPAPPGAECLGSASLPGSPAVLTPRVRLHCPPRPAPPYN